jgi:hypothetical protein
MSGEIDYFYDDLQGTGLSVRTKIDWEGDLWIAVVDGNEVDFESVLLAKDEAARLAQVLLRYAQS